MPILAIIFVSWMFLFIRWIILLRSHDIKIPLKNNLLIYLAGYSLSITPAKSGEFLKSILLKNKYNIKQSSTAAIILSERFFDVIGTFIVSILAIGLLGITFLSFIPLIFGVGLAVFLILYKKFVAHIVDRIAKNHFLKKYTNSVNNIRYALKKIQEPKIFATSITLTIVYRLIEAVGIYLILTSLRINVPDYFIMAGTYSLSTIVGTISFSPGGLGITEGSFGGLLLLQQIELQKIFSIAIIVRLFTLWYAVLVGFIALRLSR